MNCERAMGIQTSEEMPEEHVASASLSSGTCCRSSGTWPCMHRDVWAEGALGPRSCSLGTDPLHPNAGFLWGLWAGCTHAPLSGMSPPCSAWSPCLGKGSIPKSLRKSCHLPHPGRALCVICFPSWTMDTSGIQQCTRYQGSGDLV